MSLLSEIREQPACLLRLLETQKAAAEQIAHAIRMKDVRFVFIAARGTSENAARYANYLWGARNGLAVALAAPSLFTYYNCPPRLEGALVVGISQSGESPDIVSVITEGRRQGCLTLAITNAVHSPLANAADFVLDIQAGDENAVAATKTYTAQLMAIAMLSAALGDEEVRWQQLLGVPDWMEEALLERIDFGAISQNFRAISKCVVLGRGFNYATVCEWALKLKELTYVQAHPYSSADFLHGPIAMVDREFPIMAVVAEGAVSASIIDVLKRLRNDRNAELIVISNSRDAIRLAQTSLPIPDAVPEWLSPLVSIVSAQLFSYHLAVAKGRDTESPRGINKVTITR